MGGAAAEADRLGLEMTIFSSAGWSETGGPWVKPQQAMKKFVWTAAEIFTAQAEIAHYGREAIPNAAAATTAYSNRKEEQDEDYAGILAKARHPLRTHSMVTASSKNESKRLNDAQGARVIISASGMMTGGRVLHHALRLVPDPDTTLDYKGKLVRMRELGFDPAHYYGTINCLGLSAKGDICGVTTTSGLSFKIPGRVGDSPILGAGLYVDNEIGAAGSTGRGEANLYNLCSFFIVENLRRGMHPKDAGLEALKRVRAGTVEKRLLTETDERAAELAIINGIQQGLAAELDMQAMYDLVGDKIQEIFDAQVVDIGIFAAP